MNSFLNTLQNHSSSLKHITPKEGGKTLVFGMGGGYDIYTCLPWYLGLKQGDQERCILANYTFADDIKSYTTEQDPFVAAITPDTKTTDNNKDYFPELHLAKKINTTIYAVRWLPCPLLIDVVKSMVQEHNINQIVLFDGGIDSVIFGDEGELYGSPLDDSQTLIASVMVSNMYNIPCTLVTSAFSIDECNMMTYCNHWSELSDIGATFGTFLLSPNLNNWDVYKDIVQSSSPPSIIQECIIAATEGKVGLYLNPRLYPERIDDLNDFPILRPETSLYWLWDAKVLFEKSPFYQHLFFLLTETKDTELDWLFWEKKIHSFMNKD